MGDVDLLIEMGFEISVFLHLEGFFFVETVVLLVLLGDVVPRDRVDF